jgi:hypothetical protein
MSFARPILAHPLALSPEEEDQARWADHDDLYEHGHCWADYDDLYEHGRFRAVATPHDPNRAVVDRQDGAIPGGGTLPAAGDTPDTIPQQLAALADDLARLAGLMGPNAGLAVNARRLAWDLKREWGL